MTIALAVADRIAAATYDDRPVGGNTYTVTLTLDAEWTGTLYLRTRWGSSYYDIPFASTDATIDVQLPIDAPEVGVGVYSEALQISSSEARIRIRPSILEFAGCPVEFDSTLYDQWASEVTQLLTDSDWDASSTRPLRNSVLTAWKGTVALDADVVHKTGAETVEGVKTFTSAPKFTGTNLDMSATSGYNNLYINSRGAYQTVRSRKLTEGGTAYDSVFELGTSYASDTTLNLILRAFAPRATLGDTNETQAQTGISFSINRLGSGWMQAQYIASDGTSKSQRLYNITDGTFSMVAPTYTADNYADDKVVNRSMLAQTPTVVHTTGNEEIAGAKTFTGQVSAWTTRYSTYGYFSPVDNDFVVARIPKTATNTHLLVTVNTSAAGEMRAVFFVASDTSLAGNLVYQVGMELPVALAVYDDPDSDYFVLTFRTHRSRAHVVSVEEFSRFGAFVPGIEMVTPVQYSPSSTPQYSAVVEVTQ